MNSNITLEEVSNAIAVLLKAGKNPTLTAIRAALGNRGSTSTILKFKRQVDQSVKPAEKDSQPALEHFRNLWQMAVTVGRSERDAEVTELTETVEALSGDNERLEAESSALRARVQDLDRQREQLISDLAKAHQDVSTAQADGQQHAASAADALQRLMTAQQQAATVAARLQEEHSSQVAALQKEVIALTSKVHEIVLAKTTLAAELQAARHEVEQLEKRATTNEERAHSLSLALAEAAKRPSSTKSTKGKS